MFSTLNTAQWMWYYNQYMEDQESSFISNRNFVEYNASFTNPEAVSKIKEAREKAVTVPDSMFNAGLKTFFGREIGNVDVENRDKNHVDVNPSAAIERYNKIVKSNEEVSTDTVLNYKYWLDSKLE